MNRVIEKQLQKMISVRALSEFWQKYSAEHKVGANRLRPNIIHRHVFFTIARKNTSLSLNGIASIISKNHATVLHACKKHDMNYRFDPDYRLVYDNMFVEVEDFLLENGIVPKTIHPHVSEVEDIHFKYIDVSRRLRDKIKELEAYRLSIELDKKNVKHIKKQNKELYERNQVLNDECLRLKNLI
jgi:hypothetical protein